jgi:hypothetical protein
MIMNTPNPIIVLRCENIGLSSGSPRYAVTYVQSNVRGIKKRLKIPAKAMPITWELRVNNIWKPHPMSRLYSDLAFKARRASVLYA